MTILTKHNIFRGEGGGEEGLKKLGGMARGDVNFFFIIQCCKILVQKLSYSCMITDFCKHWIHTKQHCLIKSRI